jgi:hypothetical protein
MSALSRGARQLLGPVLLAMACMADEQRPRPAYSTRLATYSIRSAAEKLGRRDWTELTQGNRIVLPARLGEQLRRRSIPTTQFQICNPENKEKRIYTSCLDFCSADGECYLPSWLMRQLKLKDGDMCAVATAQFPSGVFARFQPHSSDFLDISNYYYVLLQNLDHYAALTEGSTIRVLDGSRIHFLDVIEVRAKEGAPDASKGKAIDLRMVELTMEFSPPKDQEKLAKAGKEQGGDAATGAAEKAGATGAPEAKGLAEAVGDGAASAASCSSPASAAARGAAKTGGKAPADAAPVAKFKTASKAAKPAVGRKLSGTKCGKASTPSGGGELDRGLHSEAELPESAGGASQQSVLRVVRQLVAALVAVVHGLIKLLFSPSAKGTAATQVGD